MDNVEFGLKMAKGRKNEKTRDSHAILGHDAIKQICEMHMYINFQEV